MSAPLTDEQRASLASRFKLRFLPRVDASFTRANEEAMAENARAATLALEIVEFFEKEMGAMGEGGP